MKTLFVVLAFFSASAFAQIQIKGDGNQLLEFMKVNSSVEGTFALGYVRGLSDMMPCVPSNISSGQRYDIVKKHLEQNPETRHEYQGVLVFRALNTAFPCKQ